MAFLKSLCIVLCVLLVSPVFAQNSTPVLLKWKLKPGEVIAYRTIMQEIDTANTKFPSFGEMDKSTSDSAKANFKKIMEGLKKERENDSTISVMYEKKKDVIDIAMIVKSKPVEADAGKKLSEYQNFQTLMNKATSGVMLRGAIHEDGSIQSFYTKGDQKNIIASFFELPGRPVSVGDSWPISVNFISMDQNFVCDSSYYHNKVTVTGIAAVGNDKIVTIKYDITEYINGEFDSPFISDKTATMMKFTYQATADFSIEKGRWIKYDGIMSYVSTGMMAAQSTQRFSLIPVK